MRGPVYPAFVALLLVISEAWFPTSVQIAQSLLHACTCLLVYRIGFILFNRRSAIIASILTAIHPYLIWFTAKIVTESLATFLFTAIVFAFIFVLMNPKAHTVVLLGAALGIAALCKASLLPLVIGAPLLLMPALPRENRLRIACSVFGIAILLIAPWTLRNYALTDRFVPVHSLFGYNLRIGDVQAEFYERAPFSYFQLLSFKEHDVSSHGDTISHPWLRNAETVKAVEADDELLRKSLTRYLDEPLLVVRKLLFGTIMFWTLSSNPLATAFSALMQVPLLVLFIPAAVRVFRLRGVSSTHALSVLLVGIYVICHIPIFAVARFSVVLVPTMLVYVVGRWFNPGNAPPSHP